MNPTQYDNWKTDYPDGSIDDSIIEAATEVVLDFRATCQSFLENALRELEDELTNVCEGEDSLMDTCLNTIAYDFLDECNDINVDI